ncbi:hypothetical protein MtrunA17_Chr3g0116331 [Medicago truncatula]|uniref:Transmembrane protein n=1 Tax=Medicago truncatula TaxID=3880 RepID=A0A396IW36_MEDTR|nr:hypothetical protein MtrunA17_Chr3g0116331 [Medicago truncatula]
MKINTVPIRGLRFVGAFVGLIAGFFYLQEIDDDALFCPFHLQR